MMTEKPAGKVILFRDCKMLLFMGAETSGCEHSCIHSADGFSCDCNLGFTLNDDRRNYYLEIVKMLLLWGQKLLGVNKVVYILEKALVVIVI